MTLGPYRVETYPRHWLVRDERGMVLGEGRAGDEGAALRRAREFVENDRRKKR